MATFFEVLGSRNGNWVGADNEFIAPDATYMDFFGDVSQTLSGNAQGGDDTLEGGEGGFLKFFWGDARMMTDHAAGGFAAASWRVSGTWLSPKGLGIFGI